MSAASLSPQARHFATTGAALTETGVTVTSVRVTKALPHPADLQQKGGEMKEEKLKQKSSRMCHASPESPGRSTKHNHPQSLGQGYTHRDFTEPKLNFHAVFSVAGGKSKADLKNWGLLK